MSRYPDAASHAGGQSGYDRGADISSSGATASRALRHSVEPATDEEFKEVRVVRILDGLKRAEPYDDEDDEDDEGVHNPTDTDIAEALIKLASGPDDATVSSKPHTYVRNAVASKTDSFRQGYNLLQCRKLLRRIGVRPKLFSTVGRGVLMCTRSSTKFQCAVRNRD